MFAYGRTCTSCVSVPRLSMRVISPIGSPPGYSDGSRSVSETVPRVTTRSPGLSFAPGGKLLSSRSLGLPAADRLDDPEDAELARARGDAGGRVARARVGQERHLRRAAEDRRYATDERLLVEHRLSDTHAVARALVDADRRVPDRRRGWDDAPGLRAVLLEAQRAARLDELAEAGVLVTALSWTASSVRKRSRSA